MKKNLLKLLGISLISFLLVGCNSNIHDSESSVSEHGTNVLEHGIKVRSLGSGTDVDGHEYKTFSYIIVPSNSSATISSSLVFADSRLNGNDYLTVSINQAAKEFTITCLQAFDAQATLTLFAIETPEVSSSVTIDYKQKMTSLSLTDNSNFVTSISAPTKTNFLDACPLVLESSVGSISTSFDNAVLFYYTLQDDWIFNADLEDYISNSTYSADAIMIKNALIGCFTDMLDTFIDASLGAYGLPSSLDAESFNYFTALKDNVQTVVSSLTSNQKDILSGCLDSNGDFLSQIEFDTMSYQLYVDDILTNVENRNSLTFNFKITHDILANYSIERSLSIDPTPIIF